MALLGTGNCGRYDQLGSRVTEFQLIVGVVCFI